MGMSKNELNEIKSRYLQEELYILFSKNLNKLDWNVNDELLLKWKKGKTGFPIVDAGMRELWDTGYMHNRLRMITASFLKNYLK